MFSSSDSGNVVVALYVSKKNSLMLNHNVPSLKHCCSLFSLFDLSELSTMAEHTKLITAKLIKYTNYLAEDDSGRFNKQFGLIFTKFVNLMKITSTRLGEAKERVRLT